MSFQDSHSSGFLGADEGGADSDTSTAGDPAVSTAAEQFLQVASARLASAVRPMIWLESVDAATARAAVLLASRHDAAVHVASSAGGSLHRRIVTADGWIGTSLAEVAERADFVLHLGSDHIQELPLLQERFLTRGARRAEGNDHRDRLLTQWMLSGEVVDLDEADEGHAAGLQTWDRNLPIPRSDWFELLTHVLLQLRMTAPAAASSESEHQSPLHLMALELTERLRRSEYAVIMWAKSLFSSDADEKILSRLLEIAKLQSAHGRLSLSALEDDPGKSTAAETVLWLTNIAGTVQFSKGRPFPLGVDEPVSIDETRREFDCILSVRTLPTDRPLPHIDFDVVIDTDPQIVRRHQERIAESASGNPFNPSECTTPAAIVVESIGIGCSGQLLRTDHAVNCFVPKLAGTVRTLPTAAELLRALTESLQGNADRPSSDTSHRESST